MDAKDPKPSQEEIHSRAALAPVFADLNKYAATMHFVGQSTIFTLTSDRATGEAYTLTHHLAIDGGKRRLMIAALRRGYWRPNALQDDRVKGARSRHVMPAARRARRAAGRARG